MAAPQVKLRIVADDATKPAFESAKKNVEGFGESVKGLLNPLELLKGAIAGLGLLAVSEFLKSSVEAAADNEAAWSRIAVAVNNAGISFRGVQGDLKTTFTEIADGTRYSETQVSSVFGTLLTLTKNYQGSLENVNVVTNLAAAMQIDLNTAAELVGRVMTGNTQMLSRYGITVKAGADAMQVLRDQFSGFAEKDGQSLQGRLAQIGNAWEDFKIALGEALTNTTSETDAANKLVDALKSMTQWIDDNKQGWQDFEDRLGRIADRFTQIKNQISANVTSSPTAFGAFVRFLMRGDAQIQGELDALNTQASGLDVVAQNRRAKAGAQANDPFAEHGEIATAQQIAANQAAVDAQSIADDLKRLAGILGGQSGAGIGQDEQQVQNLAKKGVSVLAFSDPSRIGYGSHPFAPISVSATAAGLPADSALSFGSELHQGDKEGAAAAGLTGIDSSFDTLGRTIGQFRTGALAGFFQDWQQGIQDVIDGHESLGKAIVSSARKAIGQSMATQGEATMLKAAEAAAEGLTNPAKLLQAVKLFGVGTAELAFAAALSGGGSSSGGSGGGSVTSNLSQSQGSAQGKVTVVLKGKGINFANNDDLNELKDAIQQLAGNRELEFLVT